MENDNVNYSFLPRRRAQIYVDILMKQGRTAAGVWALENVPTEERPKMASFVEQEKERKGYIEPEEQK